MKKQLILIGVAVLLICVVLSGCTEQNVTKISNKPPTVMIITNVTEGQSPLSIEFSCVGNDSDGYITSYFWDFGDGNTSNEEKPTHIFYEKGKTYTITLLIVDDDGANTSDSITIKVKPNKQPTASANADATEGLYPLSVTFNGIGNDEDGNIVSYNWDFGDGESSVQQNPKHTFSKYGKYSVKLTVTDNEGKSNTDTITIKSKIPTLKQHDYELIVWIGESNDVLSPYISRITSSLSYLSISGLSLYGDNLWDEAYDYGNEIDQFTYLSSPFTDMKEKYRLILEEYRLIGISAETFADDYYTFYYDNEYLIESAINRISNKFSSLADKLEELTDIIELVDISTYTPPTPPEITYSYGYSGSWDAYIFGKIKNTASENIKDVKIKVTLYDVSNNVIKTETISPHCSIITPQEISAFHTSIFTSYYDHFTVEVTSFETTNEQPYTGIQILSHSRNDFLDSPRVEGTVKNAGSKIVGGYIYANFYDSNSNLIAVAYDYIYLYSGQEDSFTATVWDEDDLPSPVSYYELEVYCDN